MNLSLLFAHFPVLLILAPVLGALFCLLLPYRQASTILAVIFSVITAAIAVALAAGVYGGRLYTYHLGGFAPPLGIELRIDALNAPVLLLVAIIGVFSLVYAIKSLGREIDPHRQPLFHALFLLCLSGLLGMGATNDAFNFFVFLEISSLCTYPLVALGAGHDRRALTAAFRYLILGTVGATLYLIGLGLLYMHTGTLNMSDLSLRLDSLMHLKSVQAGIGFIITGLAVKAALFPLHGWLANAYTYAPTAVSVFLSASASKVAFYALLRFCFVVFGLGQAFDGFALEAIFLPLALAGVLVASLLALFQSDLRRMLAYSSIAQMSTILLGASLGSLQGLSASFLHLLNHGLMKGALFMATGAIALRFGAPRLDMLAGVGRVMPWTMAAFIISALSLIGVPLTAGFISKWMLLTAAFDIKAWAVALVILLSSLFSLVYFWRVIEIAYFRAPVPERENAQDAPALILIPLFVLSLANLYFGMDARLPVAFAEQAAHLIMESRP